MAANVRSINGANAIIKVKGEDGVTRVVGYAMGVTVTESYVLNRIDVLGQIDSKDIEPIARTVSGTINIMRMTAHAIVEGDNFGGGGAAHNALVPRHASGASDIQRTQDAMNFMNNGFDLSIEDSTNFSPSPDVKTRYTVKGCRPTSHSFSLSRASIVGVDIAFEALSLDENDVESPLA